MVEARLSMKLAHDMHSEELLQKAWQRIMAQLPTEQPEQLGRTGFLAELISFSSKPGETSNAWVHTYDKACSFADCLHALSDGKAPP